MGLIIARDLIVFLILVAAVTLVVYGFKIKKTEKKGKKNGKRTSNR